MKTYYKNDLNRAYMILEGGENDKEDYQIVMLKENEIPGILNMDMRYIDNQCQYYYDISGKISLRTCHEKVCLTAEDMKHLVNNLLQTIQVLKKYMLDGTCILLDPEYIFCEKNRYSFCYYPFCKQDIRAEFHRLTEFFVREVNYKDEEGVHFAYTLHKATMEENYSIEDVMKQFLPQENTQQEEATVPAVDYTRCMEDPVIETSLIEERESLWEPVRKFLEKSSLRKRGYRMDDL